MTLSVNSLLCRQFYACFDQTDEARITRFSLYSSYMRIKFHDVTETDLRISSIISD